MTDRTVSSKLEVERFLIVTGGDGYATVTVEGREAMERAFVRAHWPSVDFDKPLNEEEQQTYDFVRDEEQWSCGMRGERECLNVSYEDGWVNVFRITDTLAWAALPAPETTRSPEAIVRAVQLDRLATYLQSHQFDAMAESARESAKLLRDFAGVSQQGTGTSPHCPGCVPQLVVQHEPECPVQRQCKHCDNGSAVSAEGFHKINVRCTEYPNEAPPQQETVVPQCALDAGNVALTCDGACRYDNYGRLDRDPNCSTHGQKAAVPLPPCECLVRDKQPSAYHNVKCPRFVADKL